MTTSLSTAATFEALSRVCGDVSGLKVVHGVNIGGAQNALVHPLVDEIDSFPAIVLVPGAWENVAGGAARVTYRALGTILVPREAPGDGSVALMNVFDLLVDAFAARSKAYSAVTILQSVLITTGPGLTDTEWPVDSNRWFLTWPFELEVKANPNSIHYQAQ